MTRVRTRARSRAALFLLAFSSLSLVASLAQTPAQTPVVAEKPLPDIVALMREVEAHQKATEAVEHDYIFHSFSIGHAFDSHGTLRKTQTEDSEIFYVADTRIRRLLKKDGAPLSPGDQDKETRRIDKEIDQAKRSQAKGKPDSPRDEVTVSRFLALGSFSNARRVQLDGRDTIAVDFTGDPKAKTESPFEGAIREMAGTVWVDEQDRALRKLEGHFLHDFKVGGGLLADIKQGTTFSAEWTKVNGEIWLPAAFAAHGDLRVLLFVNVHGTFEATNSDYRKFKATSTIVPVTPTASDP